MTRIWIHGIYKVISYREGEFLAFYIADGDKNWGMFPCPPPHNRSDRKCWLALDEAIAACHEHSQRNTPKASTVKQARKATAATQEKGKRLGWDVKIINTLQPA